MPLSQVMSHSIDSIYFSYKYSVFRYITKKKEKPNKYINTHVET